MAFVFKDYNMIKKNSLMTALSIETTPQCVLVEKAESPRVPLVLDQANRHMIPPRFLVQHTQTPLSLMIAHTTDHEHTDHIDRPGATVRTVTE